MIEHCADEQVHRKAGGDVGELEPLVDRATEGAFNRTACGTSLDTCPYLPPTLPPAVQDLLAGSRLPAYATRGQARAVIAAAGSTRAWRLFKCLWQTGGAGGRRGAPAPGRRGRPGGRPTAEQPQAAPACPRSPFGQSTRRVGEEPSYVL